MKKVVVVSNWMIVHGKEQQTNLFGEVQHHLTKEFGRILHRQKWMLQLIEASSI